jgi:hypothetical protein
MASQRTTTHIPISLLAARLRSAVGMARKACSVLLISTPYSPDYEDLFLYHPNLFFQILTQKTYSQPGTMPVLVNK